MGCWSKISINDVFLSIEIDFISENSADPNGMLGLHCLPLYLFVGIQNEKG